MQATASAAISSPVTSTVWARLMRAPTKAIGPRFWFRVPKELTRQMASKGSIVVDGVSLTLVDVEADRFSVALIPHTLAATTLGSLKPGGTVNLETDLLAKYIERQVKADGET